MVLLFILFIDIVVRVVQIVYGSADFAYVLLYDTRFY